MNSKAENVHPDLIKISLDRVEGHAFERFAQDFWSALEGRDFVSGGGIGDGGADGLREYAQDRVFYQFTIQENHRDKIRKTVERLCEFDRTVKTLYYGSSRVIDHIDKEEDLLSEELGVFVKIRDRKYIASHINDSIGTIAAYNNHLSVYTQFLESVARSSDPSVSRHVQDPSVFVFLQHEVTNRLGNRKLVHSITDSVILWALSNTDPDKGIFMSEDQIGDKIYNQFPWALKLIKGHIRQRLEKLRTKNEAGREVRWYKKEKKYCLPYETRQIIKSENQTDEGLKISFIDEMKLIASNLFDADEGEYQEVAEISSDVVHAIFEKQGLLFSHFLFLQSDEEPDAPPVVSDCIDSAITKAGVKREHIEQYREYIETIIRKVFYHGSPNQRKYLSNLSRTYVLLFTLQAEPRIIEYFNTMSTSFRLFLGGDILVQALSERYLDKEHQVARNLLKMASASGISMLLSECVLEEVYSHICGTYYEFINHCEAMEQYLTSEIIRTSNKILIKSYFDAKQEGLVKSWKSFFDQYITCSNVGKKEGQEELKKYLLSEYSLSFVENSELESVTSKNDVELLVEAMLANDDKKNKALAYNTALQVHGIYGLRSKNKEATTLMEYGLKTWWVTNQRRVLKHTSEIIREKKSQYIMRPEYILNFIAMSPNCEEVRTSFKNIFPSIFGIQLGHRLDDDIFHKIMSQVGEWKDYEPGRIIALMSDKSDELKTERLKRYSNSFKEDQL